MKKRATVRLATVPSAVVAAAVAAWLAAFLLVLAPAPVGAQDTTGNRGLISFDAENTPVTQVLQILAARSGLNVITGPAVEGKTISIHLRDTPFDEALNVVVRAAGLGYERIGRSILVADPAVLTATGSPASRVFNLQYLTPLDAQVLLKPLSEDVSATEVGNQVVVRGTEAVLDQAGNLLADLDRKPGQIMLQARLIEVNTSALDEIGIDWEKLLKWQTEVTEGYAGPTAPGKPPENLDFVKLDNGAPFYRQLTHFDVAIDALITEGKARLLSNTTVVTLDGRPAEIFAGETVPVVITSLQNPGSSGGLLQTVQLEKIDVGVKLGIIARITGEDMVTVLAEPEVSRIIGFVGPNNDLPETSSRRARTLVRVRDGQPIYLGGLLSDEKRTTVKKVPILGSIPVLGALFRHYRIDNTKLDLVIEITPHLVGDSGSAAPAVPPLGQAPDGNPGEEKP